MPVVEQNVFSPDLLPSLSDALHEGGIEHQYLGGVAIAPLLSAEAVFCRRYVEVPETVFKSNYRRPEVGEVGDADIQLLSSDPDELARADNIAAGKITEDTLSVDFSRTYTASELQQLAEHPFAWRSLKAGVADRFATAAGVVRAAPPFQVTLEPEALATHWIMGKDFGLPIPPVGTLIGNYANRSPGGIRKRNGSNVDQVTAKFLREVPGAYEWMMEGPGRSQLRLAELFMGLRGSGPALIGDPHSHSEHLVLTPADPKSLREAPEFMYRDAPAATQTAVLKLSRLKARLIRTVEQNSELTKFWSIYLMPHAKGLFHPNDKK